MGLLFKEGYLRQGSLRQGSAILIVVLVMAVLSVCCMAFWQNSQLFHDISLKRLAYEQKYRAASCGLDYAICLCSKNFAAVSQGSFEIETGDFEFSDNIRYKCKIYITNDGSKGFDLKSVLINMSGENTFQVSCSLQILEKVNPEDKNAKKFLIKNWKVCE